MSDWTVEEVFNRALLIEKQSVELYEWAAKKAAASESRSLLKRLAKEELGHKAKLEKARNSKAVLAQIGSKAKEGQDLGIANYHGGDSISEDADYGQILLFAAKREKETYEYYLELSQRLSGTQAGKLFAKLAQEELKHKKKIETEYDDKILREN